MTQTLTAEEVFRKAYENRYVWDENFPGYTCDITLKTPEGTYTGKGQITPDLKYSVFGIEDGPAKKGMEQQLWEITIHRVNDSFEKAHGENTFSFGQTDADGAVEILVGGAAAGNKYKVKDNVVTLVYRKVGNLYVTINTFEVLHTEKGYLSLAYDSVYTDVETGEQKGGRSVFRDKFEKIGDYYILTNRQITKEENGKTSVTEYTFSNIVLGA